MKRQITTALLVAVAGFLLSGCDQSMNVSGQAETQLTGMYCDAKGDQEQTCKPGDIVLTVKGREHLLCDWGWQIIPEPGTDDVRCVYRGVLRESRNAGVER